jgi:branched-chain amino acid transport system ATP-binding protein
MSDRPPDRPLDGPLDRPLLELRGVRAAYGTIEVLHGVDLEVAGGSVLAILGPNGAGKTTTLKVISGAMAPTAGSVTMEGLNVTGSPADRLAQAGVCLIPEGRGVFPNLTVRENLLMDTFAGRRTAREVEAIAFARFPRLAERRTQLAGTLSGGEQQMLSLSRALTTDPALILLDELSMGLAPVVVAELFEVVRHLADEGVTTVVVEQFAGVTAFVDRVAIMTHGRIQAIGTPDEMHGELAGHYLGAAS